MLKRLDRNLLQRIRLEVAAQPSAADQLTNLADVVGSELQRHVRALFYGGEIRAEAHTLSGGLHLGTLSLTAHGVLAMHAGLSRMNKEARQ